MSKYLVETYYTCSIKVSHYLDDISKSNLESLEKREDGKFEILDMKLDNRKTKNLEKIDTKKVNVIDEDSKKIVPNNSNIRFVKFLYSLNHITNKDAFNKIWFFKIVFL